MSAEEASRRANPQAGHLRPRFQPLFPSATPVFPSRPWLGIASLSLHAVSQVNSEWYEKYKALRAALAGLPAPEKNTAALLREGAAVRRDYEPAPPESLMTLIRATEQLLAASESSPGSGEDGFDVTAAEACRKVRKRSRRCTPVVEIAGWSS